MTKSDTVHALIVLFPHGKPDLLSLNGEVLVDKNTGRFIAVNLTDAEWQALRTVAPDPVAWVKQQIHRLLDESGVTPLEHDLGHDTTSLLELAD